MTLAYARRPKRRRGLWSAVTSGVACLIVLGVYRRPVTAYVVDRYTVWQIFRAEAACRTASAGVGELVFRTDGLTDGLSNAHNYTFPAGPLRTPNKMIGRRSEAFSTFWAGMTSNLKASQRSPPHLTRGLPLSGPWLTHADDALVDCTPRTLPDGSPALAWVSVRGDYLSFEIVTQVTRPATRTRRPTPVPTQAAGDTQYCDVLHANDSNGPLRIRRVAAAGPDDIRLKLEHGGAADEVVITWAGDHYDVRPVQTTTFVPGGSDFRTTTPVKRPPALPDQPDTTAFDLGRNWFITATLAADDAGVTVVRQFNRLRPLEVERFDFASRKLRPLLSVTESKPGDALLSRDGKRMTVVADAADTPSGRLPVRLTQHDLQTGGRRDLGQCRLASTTAAAVMLLDDDGQTLVVRDGGPMLLVEHPDRPARPLGHSAETASVQGTKLVWSEPTGHKFGSLSLWRLNTMDTATGRQGVPLEDTSKTELLRLSPDGRHVFVTGGPTCVMEPATWQVAATMLWALPNDAVFSADGRWMAVGGHVGVLVDLHSPDGLRRWSIPREHGVATAVTFMPDGKHLVVMDEGRLRVVSLKGLE